jgi:hypothetical protein
VRRDILDRNDDPFAYQAANVVDMLIMQDGKEPGAQIGSGLPKVFFGKRTNEAALHQIVGPRQVFGQCSSIAPQAWDLWFEKLGNIARVSSYGVPATSCVARSVDPTSHKTWFPCRHEDRPGQAVGRELPDGSRLTAKMPPGGSSCASPGSQRYRNFATAGRARERFCSSIV